MLHIPQSIPILLSHEPKAISSAIFLTCFVPLYMTGLLRVKKILYKTLFISAYCATYTNIRKYTVNTAQDVSVPLMHSYFLVSCFGNKESAKNIHVTQ